MFQPGSAVFDIEENHSVLFVSNDEDACWVYDPFGEDVVMLSPDKIGIIKYGGKPYLGEFVDSTVDELDMGLFEDDNKEIVASELIKLDEAIVKDNKFEIII